MDATNILGMVAASLTTFAFLPQVMKVRRTQSAKDISWLMLVCLIGGICLWIVYGVCVRSLPILFANGITLLLNLAILSLKLKYG